MRDIKFRGYCEDMNEWVYGSLVHFQKEFFTNKYNYSKYDFQIQKIDVYIIIDKEVKEFTIADTKTIGQYTGLKDKNGVEIYEGDIVKAHYIIGHGVKMKAVIFEAGTFAIDYNVGCKLSLNEFNFCSEVIGNIHDNPELLKEE